MKFEFSRQIFEKSSKPKFHKNPSGGSRVVPCGQTDVMELIVALCNFANTPNKKREVQSVVVTPTQKENCAGINEKATDSSKQTRNTGKLRKQKRKGPAKAEATEKQFVSPKLK
jgi:hypothetical protein